jgi:hypothetical protein
MKSQIKSLYAKCDESMDNLICSLKEFNQSFESSELNPNIPHAVHKKDKDESYAQYISTLQRFTVPRFVIDFITLGFFSKYIYS